MKIRNVAAIIFYDKDNKILLQDRRGISKLGSDWGFFGGEIEKVKLLKRQLLEKPKKN